MIVGSRRKPGLRKALAWKSIPRPRELRSVVGAVEAEHELDRLGPVLDALALELLRAEVLSRQHAGLVVQLLHRALRVQLDLLDLDLPGRQAKLSVLLLQLLLNSLHEALLLQLVVHLALVRVLSRGVGEHVDLQLLSRVHDFLHLCDAPQVLYSRAPRERTHFPLSGRLCP